MREDGELFGIALVRDTIFREFKFIYGVLRYDLSATFAPALLFTVFAWRNSGEQPALSIVLGRCLVYSFFYAFTFCLSNQIVGVQEDRINKPDRPLARGLVSIEGAKIRWVLGMLGYLAVGGLFGVLPWVLLWQVLTLLHNFGSWSKQWYTKNLFNGLGVFAGLSANWQLVGPITPLAWRWIVALSVVVFMLVGVQDLRDIVGDRAGGRRTFPIAFGEWPSRIVLATGFMVLPIVSHWLLSSLDASPISVLIYEMLLLGMSLVIATRVVLFRSRSSDHHTYKLFTYWYCAALASGVVI